jgi:hypothetical protein
VWVWVWVTNKNASGASPSTGTRRPRRTHDPINHPNSIPKFS